MASLKQLRTCLSINDDGFGGTKVVPVGVVVPLEHLQQNALK
jgi:hypothetical protein